jgi:microcystin-dependent protein
MGQRRIDELELLSTGLTGSDLMLVGVEASPGVFRLQKVVIEDLISMLGITPDQPGDIRPTAASSTRAGYLLCDGAAVSRSAYAALFAAIGTAYGVGDGSTTFNLPDLRGRFPLGAGSGPSLTARSRGQKDGVESVALTINQSPPHSHQVRGSSGQGSANGGIWLNSSTIADQYYSGPPYINSAGGGQPHENMPPFTVINYLIKY